MAVPLAGVVVAVFTDYVHQKSIHQLYNSESDFDFPKSIRHTIRSNHLKSASPASEGQQYIPTTG
jgi:hypothetical protein